MSASASACSFWRMIADLSLWNLLTKGLMSLAALERLPVVGEVDDRWRGGGVVLWRAETANWLQLSERCIMNVSKSALCVMKDWCAKVWKESVLLIDGEICANQPLIYMLASASWRFGEAALRNQIETCTRPIIVYPSKWIGRLLKHVFFKLPHCGAWTACSALYCWQDRLGR